LCIILSCVLGMIHCESNCAAALSFTSEKGRLYANGNLFNIKGVSWFGYETTNNVFHGL